MPQYDQYGRVLLTTEAPIQTLDGGSGAHDYIDIQAGASALPLTLNFAKAAQLQSLPNGSKFKHFERAYVQGSTGDDHLSAGTDFYYFQGGDGNDVLSGGASTARDDVTGLYSGLYGGAGSDTLTGGTGNGVLSGDDGDDFIFGGSGAINIYGGAGADIVYSDAGTTYGGDGDDSLDGGSLLYGDAGNDHVTLSFAGTAYGGDGDDVLNAFEGFGNLFGGAGEDILITSVDGGTMDGGAGIDTYYTGRKGATIHAEWGETIYGGSGVDVLTMDLSDRTDDLDISFTKTTRQIEFSNGGTINGVDTVDLTLGSGNDNAKLGKTGGHFAGGDGDDILTGGAAGVARLEGNAGDDTIKALAGDNVLSGGTGDDNITGGKGNDTLSGDEDNDVLRGGVGNDTALGGDGADKLYGDAGNDVLTGGAGNDTLTGGLGFDTFVFRHQDGDGHTVDTITDFEVGIDTLVLGDLVTGFDVGRTSTTLHLATGDDIVFMGNVSIGLQTFLHSFLPI